MIRIWSASVALAVSALALAKGSGLLSEARGVQAVYGLHAGRCAGIRVEQIERDLSTIKSSELWGHVSGTIITSDSDFFRMSEASHKPKRFNVIKIVLDPRYPFPIEIPNKGNGGPVSEILASQYPGSMYTGVVFKRDRQNMSPFYVGFGFGRDLFQMTAPDSECG
jgi:hypothetical protein